MLKLKELIGEEGIYVVMGVIAFLFTIGCILFSLKACAETLLPICPQAIDECGNPTYARVTATAYTSRVQETDDTPYITATGDRVRKGYIGVSRSLEEKFPMKTIVYCRMSDGTIVMFRVMDRMSARWTDERIDVWHEELKDAEEFGVQRGYLWSE